MPFVVLLLLAALVRRRRVPRGAALPDGRRRAAAGERRRGDAARAGGGPARRGSRACCAAGSIRERRRASRSRSPSPSPSSAASSLGALAYLVRSSGYLVGARRERRRLGRRPRDATGRRSSCSSSPISRARRSTIAVIVVVAVVEMIRAPSRWMPPFLITVVVGEVVLVNIVKQLLDRVRPTFNPDRRDARPVVPERALGHRRGALRRGCARARAPALAAGAGAPRRRRRRHRRRRRLQPRHARRALALRRRRRARVRLGLVLDLRDRVRRPVPPLRRPGREGDPRRRGACPSRRPRRSDVVEVALQRAEQPAAPARDAR